MRIPVYLLLGSLLLAGCKRKSDVPAAEPEVAAAATPTPEPTPEATPTPEPVDLNSVAVVLCYHRFEDKAGREMVSTPAEFEAQMQALKDNDISVISMDDFLAWRRGEKGIPKKSVVITLDDGWNTGYSVAWPILKKFDYPFTMFIYSDYVKGGPKAGGGSITWDQLAEMRDAGVDIGSHTVSHTDLRAKKGKTDEQYREWLKTEIAGSKQILEDKLGIKVKTIAYPYGNQNEIVREVVKEAGYEGGFTVYGQHMGHAGDPTLLGRYAVDSKNPDIFTKKVLAFPGSAAAAGGPVTTEIPASSVLTVPAEGEVVTASEPEIKINLATFGNIDPKSVTMRISGVGPVPAKYDPATKNLSYKLVQKVYAKQVTVIVGATVNGKKVETRWSFQMAPPA